MLRGFDAVGKALLSSTGWTGSGKPFPTQFPYDTIYIIISFAACTSPRDLPALSLVNKAFFEGVENWRWKDVHIHLEPSTPFSPADRKLDVLIREGRPARIRRLRLDLDSTIPTPSKTSFIARVHRLLAEAVNLRALTIRDRYSALWIPKFPPAVPSFSLQLEEFTCHDDFAPGLWDFVVSQRGIRRLATSFREAYAACAGTPLSPDSLPELEAIVSDSHSLVDIVQGRPVKYIGTTSKGMDYEHNVLYSAIVSSTCAITALSIEVEWDERLGMLLRGLALHAESLRYLSVTLNHEWGTVTPESFALPLRELAHLQCIRWRGASTDVGSVRLMSSRWHPALYAGSSLRIVQHEAKLYSSSAAMPLSDFEGIWERHEVNVNSWKIRPGHHISPRLISMLDFDPLALQYM